MWLSDAALQRLPRRFTGLLSQLELLDVLSKRTRVPKSEILRNAQEETWYADP